MFVALFFVVFLFEAVKVDNGVACDNLYRDKDTICDVELHLLTFTGDKKLLNLLVVLLRLFWR